MPTVIVHILNEPTMLGEIEELPSPTDQSITLTNPRARNNKPLDNVEAEAISLILPLHRIHFIEVMPTEEVRGEVDLFFRT